MKYKPEDAVLCSDCFQDFGLRNFAYKIGLKNSSRYNQCGSKNGSKLTIEHTIRLADLFFVWGSTERPKFGAAPRIQFNKQMPNQIEFPSWLKQDAKLFTEFANISFFHYGPRLWMLGEVTPLLDLQNPNRRASVIKRILKEYPSKLLKPGFELYRLRTSPDSPNLFSEYDSPPKELVGSGRLCTQQFPVLYCSSDLKVCAHECEIQMNQNAFLATLTPKRKLKMLNLHFPLAEENTTEFESLDMAVHQLFLAEAHSYPISRAIAKAAKTNGFDGIIYSSFYSLIKQGARPLPTSLGISHRHIAIGSGTHPQKFEDIFGIFGRPIEAGLIEIKCINRLQIIQAELTLGFGPAGFV